MKLTYDPKQNIAYLRLKNKTTQVETIHISESINIDLSPDGTVYGIELLNANKQLSDHKSGKLVVENSSTGKSAVLSLK